MEDTKVGERIRILREINCYTREALAEKVDISTKFLYDIETGKKGFSANTLCRIAEALSVSCDFIMFGESTSKVNLNNIVAVLNKFENSQMGKIFEIISSIYDLSIKK